VASGHCRATTTRLRLHECQPTWA